ncbi:hypothetical protein N665_3180s0002 [Sinapis alba]|nr:hypothetical protein N665_3180s0002 [Sinapis alba]
MGYAIFGPVIIYSIPVLFFGELHNTWPSNHLGYLLPFEILRRLWAVPIPADPFCCSISSTPCTFSSDETTPFSITPSRASYIQRSSKIPFVTDEHLKNVFGQDGEIVHVKISAGKSCGFVMFYEKSCAEEALKMLNGMQLGGTTVRLSWGRSPSSKQAADSSQCYYRGYGQGHEHYGYSMPQDPNAYYGGYPDGYQ